MPSEPTRTLLRGGTVISVDPALGDFRGDVLIEGDVIAAVGDLGDVPGAELIDVRDHIVFPGFVDGHRHLYQTVLRGLGVEWSLVEYCIGMFGTVGGHLSAADVYLGTLLGALDSVDAGVTGVYDLAHCQVTPEHTDRSLEALRESGLRTVFGYGGSSAQWVECLAPPFQSSTPMNDAEVRRLRNGPLSDDGVVIGGDMFTAMRSALVTARGLPNAERLKAGENPMALRVHPRDVLAFATIEGARALGKADVTGSITVGKKADIVTMTTDDISVFPVVDPVSAIVYGGSRRAVTNVFIDGRRRKADGALVGVDTAALHEAADRAAHDLIERSGIGPSWRPSFA
jgi:cytosine/adenosine deaminase-related metal-dependent hydrolase